MAAPEPARLTPTQRLHEVTMAAMARKGAVGQGLTLKQNAAGVWLCDALQLHQREEESDAQFIARAADDRNALAVALAGVVLVPNGGD